MQFIARLRFGRRQRQAWWLRADGVCGWAADRQETVGSQSSMFTGRALLNLTLPRVLFALGVLGPSA
ncbi:hypothetical protein AB0E63_21795 [Kribbella sp. NPDC026596]|uniref:hypothetical protein n=1 Tax=Kribbella sp. NPDC026596 TaxID=3155122 RepID=UPI00340B9EBB